MIYFIIIFSCFSIYCSSFLNTLKNEKINIQNEIANQETIFEFFKNETQAEADYQKIKEESKKKEAMEDKEFSEDFLCNTINFNKKLIEDLYGWRNNLEEELAKLNSKKKSEIEESLVIKNKNIKETFDNMKNNIAESFQFGGKNYLVLNPWIDKQVNLLILIDLIKQYTRELKAIKLEKEDLEEFSNYNIDKTYYEIKKNISLLDLISPYIQKILNVLDTKVPFENSDSIDNCLEFVRSNSDCEKNLITEMKKYKKEYNENIDSGAKNSILENYKQCCNQYLETLFNASVKSIPQIEEEFAIKLNKIQNHKTNSSFLKQLSNNIIKFLNNIESIITFFEKKEQIENEKEVEFFRSQVIDCEIEESEFFLTQFKGHITESINILNNEAIAKNTYILNKKKIEENILIIEKEQIKEIAIKDMLLLNKSSINTVVSDNIFSNIFIRELKEKKVEELVVENKVGEEVVELVVVENKVEEENEKKNKINIFFQYPKTFICGGTLLTMILLLFFDAKFSLFNKTYFNFFNYIFEYKNYISCKN